MTLRHLLASALRRGAMHATVVGVKLTGDSIAAYRAGDVPTATRLLVGASRVGVIASSCLDLAGWLEPHPHAQAGAAGLDPNRARVEPAAPAGARVVGGEQAGRPAAADAKGGQGGEGSTAPLKRCGCCEGCCAREWRPCVAWPEGHGVECAADERAVAMGAEARPLATGSWYVDAVGWISPEEKRRRPTEQEMGGAIHLVKGGRA